MAMNYNTKRISVDFLLIPRVGWVKSIQSGDLHEVFLSCMVIVFVYRIQLEMYLKKKSCSTCSYQVQNMHVSKVLMHIGLVDLELAWLATQYVAIFQPPSINIAGYRLISKCGFKYPLHLLLKKESFIKATREIQKASLPPLTHETGSTRALNLASSRFRSSLPRYQPTAKVRMSLFWRNW